MKKNICASAFLLFILGCSNSESPVGMDSMQVAESSVNVLTSAIVSDPSLDPYTVENMNKAMRKTVLAKTSTMDSLEVESMELKPNYLYVRFLVNGKAELAELKSRDTTVVYFKHPLDYKPIKKPAVYVDPTLPDSVRAYFATVPVDFDFGATKHDIIKELYLVEPLDGEGEDVQDSISAVRSLLKKTAPGNSVVEKLAGMGISLQEVELASLEMTGSLSGRLSSNFDNHKIGDRPKLAWSLFSSAKKLGGQLKFMDDILGEQPLVGVRVTGGYSYYWREAHTDEEGKFKIPEKWSFDIDYEANFDSDDFLLEDGHSRYGEDLEIEKNDKHSDWKDTFKGDKAKWCVVWTAAYQYWYGDRFGLKKPRSNTASNMSMDIEVYYKDNDDYKKNVGCGPNSWACTHTESFFLFDDYISVQTRDFNSRIIYRNTIHEIAHISQYENQKKGNYSDLDTVYIESFARGIEIYFARKRYADPELIMMVNGHVYGTYGHIYTGLVDDLIDNVTTTADAKKNIDKVSGFTIKEIETAFFNSKSWDALKSYIKNNYPSGKNGRKYTSSDLDNLFDYWKNI